MVAACWRWSDVSVEDAQRQADARAVELAKMFAAGTPLDRYGYGDRAMREEIVQTVARDARGDAAVITRNAYGALVLNTSGVMFIDIDFAQPANPLGGLFRRLMGGPKPAGPEELGLRKIQDWAAQRSELGLRVYRTFAGLRCLVTNRTFDVTQATTTDLLASIGSDPLYVRLCRVQGCFRARLTPKPWRCRTPLPPARWPWTNADVEARFRQWQSGYERSSQAYGVCRFLRHFGATQVHPEIRAILDLHDQFSCQHVDQPLA